MKSPSRAGALASTADPGERRPDDVLAQDVLELDGLRRRRDVVGGQLGQDRVLIEDVVELALEQAQLRLGQAEPGEMGDVLDVRAGERGHAPDDSRRARRDRASRYDRTMQLPTIRVMTAADVDRTADAMLREGWGDRRVKMRFVVDHPQCAPLIAEADGAIVGTGVATINGPVAWIGTIWVEPAWRRRGLGRALTMATMEAAEVAGCRTFVLVATKVGQPLYEGLGFEVQTWYRIKEAPGLAPGLPAARARRFRPSDLPSMAILDVAATGEDRGHLWPPSPDRTPRYALTGPMAPSAGSWSALHGAAGRPSRPTRTTRWPSCTLGGSRPGRTSACGPACWPTTRPAWTAWPRPDGPTSGRPPG